MDKKEDHVFYPMALIPEADEVDASYSKTVLVFGEKRQFVELGFYDFESKQWSHFGEDSFLLKCWCYVPNPENYLKANNPVSVKHAGYRDF